ncbi:MAG: PQQ-binding-like beta-propeller repeat protein [candidate division Zixibacteria bacterium]|nr:PQQ-binding-like beta-propeller repeat protein [candidate division Zixibacteria bacterium]
MKKRTAALAALILMSAGIGCSKSYKLGQDQSVSESPWAYSRGNASAQGRIDNPSFTGNLSLLWEQKEGDKPIGPLTIFSDQLVYPSSKKRLRFFNLSDGAPSGRVKQKGLAHGGFISHDTLSFFALGHKRNMLVAYNMREGEAKWQKSVKDAAPGTIIVENKLIVSSVDGLVTALDPATGKQIWKFKAKERFIAGPSFEKGRIYQPGDKGTLYVLSLADGTELFKITADGPLTTAVAVDGMVYAGDIEGQVYAIDPESRSIVWRAKVLGPIWGAPALSKDNVFIGHSGGQLVCFDKATGEEKWRFDAGEVIKAAPLAIGNFVAVGTLGGHLFVVNAETGIPIYTHRLTGAIGQAPISDGSRIYVATESGRIACFWEKNEQHTQTGH